QADPVRAEAGAVVAQRLQGDPDAGEVHEQDQAVVRSLQGERDARARAQCDAQVHGRVEDATAHVADVAVRPLTDLVAGRQRRVVGQQPDDAGLDRVRTAV